MPEIRGNLAAVTLGKGGGFERSPVALIDAAPPVDLLEPLEDRKLLSAANDDGYVEVGSPITYHDTAIEFTRDQLLANDSWDPYGPYAFTLGVATNGTVTEVMDGVYRLQPDLHFTGDVTVEYTLEDAEGSSDATLTLNFGNSAPSLYSSDFDDTQEYSVSHGLGPFPFDLRTDLGFYDPESDGDRNWTVTGASGGSVWINPLTGETLVTPTSDTFVGDITFDVSATDTLDAQSNVIHVTIHVTNSAPTPGDDGDFYAYAGDVVRVSIATLLSNDTDSDDPIVPASFTFTHPLTSSGFTVRRVEDDLIILVPPAPIGSAPELFSFTYTVADPIGVTGTGTVRILRTTGDLKQLWMAALNRAEAAHFGYRYYAALGLPAVFAKLRQSADGASYQVGSTGSANATYSPYYNTVTVPTGTTTLPENTVIHETVHIVDDDNDWYLSDYAFGTDIVNAERLAWAGQHFLVPDSTALSALRSFEHDVLDGGAPLGTRWGGVLGRWSGLASATYKYPGAPLEGVPIGDSGFGDLFAKMGISGLSSVAAVYSNELGYTLTNSAVDVAFVTRTVNPPLW